MYPIVRGFNDSFEGTALHGTNTARRSTKINIRSAWIALPAHSRIDFFMFAHIATSMNRNIADTAQR
jgi:hypothetical protein